MSPRVGGSSAINGAGARIISGGNSNGSSGIAGADHRESATFGGLEGAHHTEHAQAILLRIGYLDRLAGWQSDQIQGELEGKPYEDKGNIQTFDRDKRLAFTHWSPLSGMEDTPENYHVVSFDLRPANGGTEVVLTQTNQNDAEPLTPENRQEYAKNWTMVLEGLKKAAEGAAPSERPGVSTDARP